MIFATLGRGGPRVSRVGFGCWAIGGHGWGPVDDAVSEAAISRALDLGITLFDTADVYGLGHSEEVLGRAIRSRRQDVVIASKFGVRWDGGGRTWRDSSPRWIEQALDDSLRRMRTDYIDLYQLHWPDGATSISATMEALDRCRQAGKILSIGCSNLTPDQCREAVDTTSVVSMQLPYSLVQRDVEDGLLECCRELGVGVLTYGTLAQGLLSGKHGPDAKFSTDDVRSRNRKFITHHEVAATLSKVAREKGRAPAQLAIRWVLEHDAVTSALVGIKTPEQAEINADVDWLLSPADHSRLAALTGRRDRHGAT